METLEHLKYDDLVTAFSGYRGDDAWDLFVLMVRRGDLNLSHGPLAVIREFSDNAEIVYEDEYQIVVKVDENVVVEDVQASWSPPEP